MKECRTCKKVLPVTDFYMRKEAKDGRQYECKTCQDARRKVTQASERRSLGVEVKKRPSAEIPKGFKWCPECDGILPGTEFSGKKELSTYCKECIRWRALYRNYCLSRAEYAEMITLQGGLCRACKGELVRPCVDHDHKCCPGNKSCGRCVRGILCAVCNVTLGQVDDSAERLRSMADYIDSFKVPACLPIAS